MEPPKSSMPRWRLWLNGVFTLLFMGFSALLVYKLIQKLLLPS